ncbi:MAG TPA: xanthine dehydrogenase family protein subunit M [Anaerolineae bacterium]
MLRLPLFNYVAPKTLTEAVALKKEHGDQAMYVAGGTDLYPKMKRRQMEPKVLIGLNEIEELHTFSNGNGMTIGASLTLTEVAGHPKVNEHYPALARAAGLVSSPPLRNAGTIGGNLCVDTRCTYYDQTFQWRKALGFCMKKDGDICWVATSSPRCLAVSSSDCAPVAIALSATAHLVGPEGERTIPVEAMYRNDGQFYLAKSPDEILVSVHLPPRPGWRMTYWKLRRRGSIDFPILGVAVALRLEADGTCAEGRVVLGAVASEPVVLDEEVRNMLLGQKITPELVEAFAQKASRPAKPMDNTDMNLSYRKKMARVYIARALSEAAGLSVDSRQ